MDKREQVASIGFICKFLLVRRLTQDLKSTVEGHRIYSCHQAIRILKMCTLDGLRSATNIKIEMIYWYLVPVKTQALNKYVSLCVGNNKGSVLFY